MAFWAEQMSRIVFKLSGALVDSCCVAVGSHLRENEIKEALLSPFLSSVAHSVFRLLRQEKGYQAEDPKLTILFVGRT